MKTFYPIKLALIAISSLVFSVVLNAQVSVTATLGTTTGNYTTLKGAFDAINAGTHKGAITLAINSNTTETATAALNASGMGGASYTSVNIYPTSTGLSISGNLAAPLIDLYGAKNVTIDGRVNATGSTVDFIINNTSTAATAGTSTIRFYYDAINNIVKYCTIKGASKDSSAGVLCFSPTVGTTGNSNNTIDHNNITSSADASRPINVIYSLGISAKLNSNNTISNNNIYNFLNQGTTTYGINLSSYTSGWSITGNSFYETTSFVPTATVGHNVIYIDNTLGTNFTVTGNYIGGSAPSCGGPAWTKTNAYNNQFRGIYMNVGTGTASNLQGNVIKNLAYSNSTSDYLSGIWVNSGDVNVGTISANTFGASTGNGSITLTGSINLSGIIAIDIRSAGIINVQNNIIGSITGVNTNASYGTSFTGINISGTGTVTINNNIIGSTDAGTTNSIYMSSASTLSGQAVYGIYSQGNGSITVTGNTFSKLTNGPTGATTSTSSLLYGIYLGWAANTTITNNTVRDLTHAMAGNNDNSGSVIGIALISNSTQNIAGNTIYNLSNSNASFAGTVTGLYNSGSTTASTVSGNFIHSLAVNVSSVSANIYGIKIAAGNTTYSNNIITIGGNTRTNIYGVYETGAATNNNNIYLNTVYIGGTPAAGALNSYALYSAVTTNIRDFRDNIFYNARSNTGSASGKHYAAYFNYTVATDLTLDYNDYYAPGTGGVLGYYNSTDVTVLPLINGQDAHSVAINPAFVSAGGVLANNYMTTASLVGVAISGIATDYSGAARVTNAIGAFNTLVLPPSGLSYTTPNVYTQGIAITSLSPTVTGTVVSYSVSPSLPTGLSLNTSTGVISGTPTVVTAVANYTVTATNSGGSTTFAVSITVNAQINLTATQGTTSGGFNTLKAAFDAINAGTHKGAIVITVTANTTEAATAALNASGSGSASYTSVNIYPTSAGLSISGNLAAPLLDLNGATNVTIDGRVNATGSTVNLSVSNTNTTTTASTVRFINSASGNTIKYCAIKGSTTNTTGGILFFSTVTGSAGNNNNTIDRNNITNAADANRPVNVVYSAGTSAYENTSNTISNNNIYNFLSRGATSYGINLASNSFSFSITGNSFYETASFVPSSAATYYIIYSAATVKALTISNNYIGGSAALCGGTAWTKTNANANDFYAILATVDIGTASSIQGNTIANFSFSNSLNSSWYGIKVAGDVNIGTVSGNIIGAATGNGSVTVTNGISGGYIFGIYNNSGSGATVNIQNNTIGSIVAANTGSGNATNVYAIMNLGSNNTVTINNNIIGSTNAGTSNSINASSAATSNVQTVFGINSGGTGTITISGNTVAKLTNGTSNISLGTYGLINGINASAGANTISNNTVRDLTIANANSTTTYQASISGIVLNATTSAQTITGNKIYNLSNTYASFTGNVIGLFYAGSTTASTVSGNFIYGLSATGASSTTAKIYGIDIVSGATTYANNIISLGGNTKTTLYGIYETGAASNNNNLFYNTIYIGGSLVSGSTNQSYALYSAVSTNTRDFRNNIFYNERSTISGSNLHYAAYFNYGVATNLTLDYNDYNSSGTGGVLGYYSGNKTVLPIVTAMDANSTGGSPNFVTPGGTTAANYLPQNLALFASTATGITTDYAGTTRSVTKPSMGAYDYTLSSGNVSITATAGTASGNYPTLYQALNKINDGTHQGAITIAINANTVEYYPATLYQNGYNSTSAYTSVSIYPTVTGLSISGNLPSPLIDLNGATNVTLDGRVNATGTNKDLTVTNTSTSSSASTIRFINDASSNVVKYCSIKGSSTNTAGGVLFFSTASAIGNNNNTIDKNNITCAADANRPLNAIYSYGTAAIMNSNNTVSNNNIYDFSNRSATSCGIYLYVNTAAWTITNNSFYETTMFIPTTNINYYGVYDYQSTGGHAISNNYIGGSSAQCGGTAWTKTNAFNNVFYGIYSINATNANTIQGNSIKNFSFSNSSSASWYGISTAGSAGGIVTANTIGAATGTGSVSVTNGATGGTIYGINAASGSVQNNIIGSITSNAANGTDATNIYGIYITSSGLVSNNTVGSTDAGTTNSIYAGSSSTSSNQTVIGIYATASVSGNTIAKLSNAATYQSSTIGIQASTSTTSSTITNNIIHDLSSSSASSSFNGVTSALYIVATSLGISVSGNTIYNLSNSNSALTGNVVGLYYSGITVGSNTVSENFICNLSVNTAATSAKIYGISVAAGLTTFKNNVISLTGNTPTTLYGIYDGTNSGGSNIYFNTVYISGLPTIGAVNSYALYSGNNSSTRNYKNNILNNTRSNNGATGTHYAAYFNYAANTSLALDYNDYYAPGTGGILGRYSEADVTALPLVTGNDANSMAANPTLANAGGTAIADYFPGVNLNGGTGTNVLFDYFANVRSAVTPKMGALEYASIVSAGSNTVDVYTNGTLQASYADITAAFAKVNDGTHTGSIVMKLTANETLTATAVLNASGTNSASYTDITIYPTGTGLSIMGNLNAPLIDLNGANNVTIDGRVNATGSAIDLSLINTSSSNMATTSAIRFINDAQSNAVKYCNIKSSTSDASGGIIFFSTTTGSTGNSNNTIDHNNITNYLDGFRPISAIYSNGTAAKLNAGNTISNNAIYNFLNRGVVSYGINLYTNSSAWFITGNSFYETSTFIPTASVDYNVIYIGNTTGINFTVSNNYIGGSDVQCGGSPWTKTNAFNNNFYGMYLTTATGTASNIQGNTIKNFNYANSLNGGWFTIRTTSGDFDIGTTVGNVIGASTGNGSITFTNSSGSGLFTGISGAGGTVNIQNNLLGSITVANTTATADVDFTGISGNGTTSCTVSNNTVGSTDAGTTNSIYVSSTSTNSTQSVQGINISGAGTATISGNMVAKLTNASTYTGGGVTGIYASSGGSNTVTNNTIRELSTSDTAGNPSITGLQLQNTSAVQQTITGNNIYNLSNTYSGFTGKIVGLYYNGGTTASAVTNNLINGLSVNATNAATLYGIQISAGNTTYANNIVAIQSNTPCAAYGIYETGASGNNNNLYHNTISLSGTVPSGSALSYALYSSSSSNVRNFRNNIFSNTRTNNGATGTHYAAYFNYGVTTNLTLNYNDYYVNGNGGVAFYSTAGLTGTNSNSVTLNPQLANVGGTSAADYLPANGYLLGATGTSVTTDYTNATRSVTAPAMGAYDYPVTAPPGNVSVTDGTNSGEYQSMNAAFAAINAGTYTGTITVQVKGSTTEFSTATLNASGSGSASYTSINIYPTVTGLSIAGSLLGAPLIDLNGATNVTIDGRVNATGSIVDLIIYNASTSSTATTSTIRFINDAASNTIKYCTIKGASMDASAGILFFSTTTGSTGNSNNTIDHNNITNTGDASRPINVIYSLGTSAKLNSSNNISNNNIYDFLSKGTASYGINLSSYTSGWSITGNSFYQTSSFVPTAPSVAYNVIYINNSSETNFTLTGNYIGGSASSCGGTAWTKTNTFDNPFTGIYMNVGTGTASNVQGNTIKNFTYSNSQASYWYAININAGDVNIGTGTGNIIGATTGNGSITLTEGAQGGIFYGIYAPGTGIINAQNNSIGSVTVANTAATNSTNFYGIYRAGTGVTTINNNTIGSTDTGTSNSVYASSAASSSAQTVYGIYSTGSSTVTIKDNTLAKLTNGTTNTTTSTYGLVNGIYIGSGTNTVTNNTVRDLIIANANNAATYQVSVGGVIINSGTVTASGNTIYNLSNTYSPFTGSVIGLYGSGNFSGNFIYGLSVDANSPGASIYGTRISAASTLSNNIISLGGNTQTTIYGIYETGGNNSIYFNTVYIGGSPTAGAGNSYALYSYTSSYTRDFSNNIFNNARSNNGGTGTHYAAYFNYAVTTNLTLDYNSYYVNGTGGILGYYNSANVTVLPLITAMDTHSVSIDPLFANAGGTTVADYASSATLNGVTGTGTLKDYFGNPRSFSTPKMGALEFSSAQSLPSTTIDVYIGGTLQASYADLTAAFAAINAGTHTGNIELKVTASQILTASASLNASGSGSANYTSINIYPTVTGLSIVGSLSGVPLIDLNGATNVTIDGRVNATGSIVDLMIYNASTSSTATTSTIRFINDAASNTVKYCTIKGASMDASAGILFFSTTTGSTGNSNNTIDHNNITNTGDASRPINVIYSLGTSAKLNISNIISSNNIYDFLSKGTASYGINLSSYTSGWSITGNSFYQTISFVPTATVAYNVIYINNASGYNFTVTGNYIGGSASSCGGTAWTKTNAFDNTFTGIYVNVGTGTASTIQGNTIKNFIHSNSASASWYGINAYAGDINIGTTTLNNIGATTGNGSITYTNGTTGGYFYGIYVPSTGIVNVQNNTIGSITAANATGTNATNFYGIYKSGAGTTTVNNNTIGSTDAGTSNSIYASSSATSNVQKVYGIYNAGSGSITITGNTFAKLTNGTTNTTTSTYGLINGIYIGSGTNTVTNNTVRDLTIANANNATTYQASAVGIVLNYTGSVIQTITGNIINNLSNTNTAFAGSVIGLYYGGGTTASTVTGNFINSISVDPNTATANVYGIRINSGATLYYNNIISLGGNTLTTLYGIYETGTSGNNNSLFFNTIYIGGSVASGTNKSYALYSVVNTNTRDFRNNLFVNTRSTVSGTNLHYTAYFVPTSIGSLTLNYNNYYVSGTGGTLGYFNSINLTSIPLISGSDVNSLMLNPSFANPGGTAAADYNVTAKLDGVTGTGITTDFIGTTRGTTPTMGAYDIQQSVWTGATSTDWSDATNWTPNVVPTSAVDVVVGSVTNTPTVGDNSICKSLKINTGGVITIPADKSLTVAGSITNSVGAAGIVIKSDAVLPTGTLIYHNAQNAPAQATVEMYSKASWNLTNTTGNKYKWQFFGVPVRTMVASPTLDGALVRRYDESQVTNNWFALNASSTLDPFTGYEMVQEAAKKYSYTGDLVNADYSQTLTKTSGAVNAGNHLFANPYTAAIDITKLNFGIQTDATVYLYNTGTVNEWTTNSGSTVGANPGQYTAAPKANAGVGGIPAQVPSMQGFVVKALSNDANATFGIPYSAVVVKNVEQQRVKSTDTSSDKVYTIVDVVGTTGGDRMWLFTDAGCSHSFDNGWDGRKMLGSALVPQLYASETDGDYQVNSVNDVNNTNLAFQAGTDTNYKLHFTHNNVQTIYKNLYLLDNVTGTTTDITTSGTEYSFTASTGVTPTNRFKIVATIGSTTGVNTPTEDAKVTVFSSKNTIFVQNNTSDKGDLILYDIAGRYLQKLPFNPSTITATPMGLAPGVYVAKAMINNKVMLTKNLIIQ